MTSSPTPMVDSFGTPDYPALRAAGVRLAGRYLSGGNPLTTPEVARAHAAGVGLVLICERSATAALGGRLAGINSAIMYAHLAHLLFAPKGVALWRTVDFDPTSPQLPTVLQYLGGFADGVRPSGYRCGAYGGTTTLTGPLPGGMLKWQSGGWTLGRDVPAEIRQLVAQETIAGVLFDEDLVLAGDVGAWMPPAPKPAPKPTPAPAAPREELEVKPIIATGTKGGVQVISADLSGKRPIAQAAVLEALLATGQYLDLRGKLDGGFVDELPVH